MYVVCQHKVNVKWNILFWQTVSTWIKVTECKWNECFVRFWFTWRRLALANAFRSDSSGRQSSTSLNRNHRFSISIYNFPKSVRKHWFPCEIQFTVALVHLNEPTPCKRIECYQLGGCHLVRCCTSIGRVNERAVKTTRRLRSVDSHFNQSQNIYLNKSNCRAEDKSLNPVL